MITHEIKKPFVETILPFVRHATPLVERVKNALHLVPTSGDPYKYHYSMGQRYMEKVSYTRWLEEQIRPKFPKGSLCTMRAAPFVPGQIPSPLMIISDLQEVAYMAPVSPDSGEPKCVLVKYKPTGITVHLPYAPSSLRQLTEEELRLVNARDNSDETSIEQPDPVG